MDRQTRRANFKNLQQASSKLRSTRSTTTTLSLTDFFSPPEETARDSSGAAPAAPVETAPPSPKIKPIRASNVFEKPGPKPKKAPKLKSSSSSTTGTARRGRGRSKQQPSISNFLRNEQIFAEVTAQHCLADNFSPDDIEMALALSKSEAEKRGCLRLNDENEAEAVVDLMDDAVESTENIRLKLQKYGFRTAAKEDYKSLAVLPVVAGKGSRRGKWANKFTALTLRNAEVQQKKLEEKVSTLMAQQVRTEELQAKDRLMPPYELISSNLQPLRAASLKSQILHEPSEGALADLGLYYVTDLIEVSRTPADHLLKNWAAIQGRDLSPKRETPRNRQLNKQLQLVYAELEKHFGDPQERDQQVVDELDALEKLVAENMIEDTSKLEVEEDASKEPPDKRPKMTKDDKENEQPPSVSVPTQMTRCTSPDLFADSDEEMDMPTICVSNDEPEELRDFSLKVYKNKSPVKEVEILSSSEEASQILTYEVFSSSSDEEEKAESDKDSQKLVESDKDSQKLVEPRLSPKIFDMSAVFESDSDIENFNFTSALDSCSQAESCPISKELFLKYAIQDKPAAAEEEENMSEIPFNMSKEEDSQTFKHSFHIDTVTPPRESHSFSDLNFSRNSLRRSASLSTDNSFKSPLNWKITASAEKRDQLPKPSPCRHSDASVDLTQNSDDDNNVILLSDEEINYSIWKANKSTKAAVEDGSSSDNSSLSSPVAKKRAVPHFQTEEDLDAFLIDGSSHSPNKSALSKERAEFGILDAAPSQPFSFSQLQSPSSSDINWAEASFLDAPDTRPLVRRSSHKFEELLAIVSEPGEQNSDNDFDEFDQLVFQSKKDSTTEAMPSGLDRLLNAEIKMPAAEPAQLSLPNEVPDQLEVAGNVYTIGICHKPKPDFASLPESEILQLLYNYGIKPLKRKQAVKMLEFIYNQTHPIMQALPSRPEEPLVRSKSTPVMPTKPRFPTEDCLTVTSTETEQDFKFNDVTGDDLLRFSQSLPLSLCDDFEFFILQTNVSKKTPQPLMPLHIAWHNLLCANPRLHESVLMYEPIDLQEIYLHFKQMGHRYDPKELRGFMDRRCIIFRYELAAAPAKQTSRKLPKKPAKRT